MSSIYIISAIVILIVCSFIISAISYTRQQALKKRKLFIKRYVQQADEALAFISLLLRVDQSYDLIIQLQNLAVNAFYSAFSINTDDLSIQQNLKAQKVKLDEYKAHQRQNEVFPWLTTDAEHTATQSQLTQIQKLLDTYRNKGSLKINTHQELTNHIQQLKNQLSINSYLYQADLYGEQNNITSYQLYIKQAIQAIKKSNMDTDEKNKQIKQLSERIQDVKRTGKTTGYSNFVKPNEEISNEMLDAEPSLDPNVASQETQA